MLRTRLITAIVLLAVLVGVLLVPRPEPLWLLLILMAVCAFWEWLRLLAPENPKGAKVGAVGMFFVLLPLQWGGAWSGTWISNVIVQGLIPVVAATWCIGATRAVVLAQQGNGKHNTHPILPAGAIIAVWAALVLLHQRHGAGVLLSLMALVWCADIAAYFAGRAWGRHKLALKVSPGKTWEGAVAGVLAATAWTLLSARWEDSFGALLIQQYSWLLSAALAALLAALSIVGDLYESLLKRRVGVKDSSALLPGHGGILDRIDALLPVVPVAWCMLHPPWL